MTPSLLAYGASGTYKTTAVGAYARYIYEKTGLPIRLLHFDGGGYQPIDDLVAAGIVEVYAPRDHANVMEDLVKLYQGFWPSAEGKLVASDVSKVGGYALEGLTTLGDFVFNHLVNHGRKGGAEETIVSYREGQKTFFVSSRGHYGAVHRHIQDMLRDIAALPVAGELNMFTAHESKGEDSQTKQQVFGPGIVGKALTPKIPGLVGDLLHLESMVKSAKAGDDEVRAYFKRHPDTDSPTIMWPAKCRLQPTQVPLLTSKWKDGYFPLVLEPGVSDLYVYLKFLDEVRAKGGQAAAEWKQQADENRKRALERGQAR